MYAIRCPKDRKHTTKSSGIEYPTCGHLLAGIQDNVIFLRCDVCKKFWELHVVDGNNVELRECSQEKINLPSNLRVII